MDLHDWSAISQLLDEALQVPPADRAAWLDRLPGRYESLKPRLVAMLDEAASDDGDAFLAALPRLDLSALEGGDGISLGAGEPGAVVGRYRLVREIASGGQGSVWLADRTDGLINRPVALKLPLWLAFRPHLAERMAREREILASLEHPHIARLYDAGVTPDDVPYLALEFVDGLPVDRYCEAHGLAIAARVRSVHPGDPGGGVRARPARDPPGPEAVQRARHRGWRRAAPRFRHRQAAGRGPRARGLDPHRGGRPRHDAALRLARAGGAAAPGRGHGHLLAGRDAVRAAHRHAPLPAGARHRRRAGRSHPRRRPDTSERSGARRGAPGAARRPRHDPPKGAAEAARRAIRDGVRAGRRSPEPSRWPTGARAGRPPVVPRAQVRIAPSGGRRGGGGGGGGGVGRRRRHGVAGAGRARRT